MSTAADKATKSPEQPTTAAADPAPPRVVLRGVDYGMYCRLRDIPENDHVKMTYHDGVLEIMSPASKHERPSRRIGVIISVLCEELGIEFEGLRSTTFRRGEPRRKKGHGKEPDECFYIANAAKVAGNEDVAIEAGDPPPDLWIEVDNRSSSAGKLPVYAALGVPEVWRYRVRSKRLRFVRLAEDRATYEPIERSLALTMLTPALVLEALALGEGKAEGSWTRELRAWVRAKFLPAAEG